MSLDFWLEPPSYIDIDHGSMDCLSKNITHNLVEMADKAGVYDALWCSEGKRAGEIIRSLEIGYTRLRLNPEYFKQFNAVNVWGLYEHLLEFVKDCLDLCRNNPEYIICISK